MTAWRSVRLKHLAAEPIRNGVGEAGTFNEPDWPRYIRTTDIAGPRSLRNDTFASLPPETAAKAPLRAGDVVLTAAGATIGKSFLYNTQDPACYAGYLVRFRPRDVDSRFVAYWTESKPYWDQIRTGKVVSTIENFSASKYQNLTLSVPPLPQQRAIADFLDAETARIDEVVEKKRRLLALLEERRSSLLEGVFRNQRIDVLTAVAANGRSTFLPKGWSVLTLGRVLRQLTNGYVGPTRDLLVDKGVKYVQGLHIKRGRIKFDAHPFYVPHDWHIERPRISLQPGDVLIVQTGDIGQTAVVPANFGPASCHALLIARPNTAVVTSEYLGVYLQSTVGRSELLRLATGALHPHLEFGIKAAPVLVPPPTEQRSIVDHVIRSQHTIDQARDRLLSQMTLLQDRRVALITSAVAGQTNLPEEEP